jgi:hypothetical protein
MAYILTIYRYHHPPLYPRKPTTLDITLSVCGSTSNSYYSEFYLSLGASSLISDLSPLTSHISPLVPHMHLAFDIPTIKQLQHA